MSCRKTRQQKEEGMANFYELADLISQKAVQELPKILDDMGYAGKYEIKKTWGIDYLSINSNYKVVSRALKRAEEAAHGEAGRLIKIKQTTFAELWVPESEAKTLKEAYETALQAVENGWKVDNDPIVEVKCAGDNEYRDEYILEKL